MKDEQEDENFFDDPPYSKANPHFFIFCHSHWKVKVTLNC